MQPDDIRTQIASHRDLVRRYVERQQQDLQQQQQRPPVPRYICRLVIYCNRHVERQNMQDLVDFLREEDSRSKLVTELELNDFSSDGDGGLDILRDFIASNDTTDAAAAAVALTKIELCRCYFGSAEEVLRFMAAFYTNTFVSDLTIFNIAQLQASTLGACLSGLLQNTRLRRLSCSSYDLSQAVPHLQPGLRVHQHLTKLMLCLCQIGNEGIRLITEALVGNTTLVVLDISYNGITSVGLVNIARLLESTQLEAIDVCGNADGFLDDEVTSRRFAESLSRSKFLKTLKMYRCRASSDNVQPALIQKRNAIDAMIWRALGINTSLACLSYARMHQCGPQLVESLPKMKAIKLLQIEDYQPLLQCRSFLPALLKNTSLEEVPDLPSRGGFFDQHLFDQHREQIMMITNSFPRNRSMNRIRALLAPHPTTRAVIGSKSEIWSKAIAKVGEANTGTMSHPGASAIFLLFQTRPAMFEKSLQQQRQPAAAAPASSRKRRGGAPPDIDGEDDNHRRGSTRSSLVQTREDDRKQRRL